MVRSARPAARASAATHVPAARVTVPDPPHDVLARPGLLDSLDRVGAGCVTVVSAPPGFGKTVQLAEWVRRSPTPTAWVSVDAEDAVRFWTTVATAVSRLRGTADAVRAVGARWAARLGHGDDLGFVDDLLGAAESAPGAVRLVLDGTEHLHPDALRGLSTLVRAGQGGLRLVLAGRSDPDLPLARLRLENRLHELGQDDLRLSADEVGRMAAVFGHRLTPAQVEQLHTRTGGWPAGVRLATRWPDGPGRDRAMTDYVAVEVLAQLNAVQREVLRDCSVVDALPAALAVALTGRDDAPEILEAVRRGTGMITVTDGSVVTYRMQVLLRASLAAELARRGAGHVELLHARAAAWFDRQERPVEALRHAGAAGDDGLLRDLLVRWAPELTAAGEHAVLDEVAAACRTPGTAGPWVLISAALADVGRGRVASATGTLRHVRRTGLPSGDRELAAYRDAVEQLCGVAGAAPGEVSADPVLVALQHAGRAAVTREPRAVAQALQLAHDGGLAFLETQCRCLLGLSRWYAGDLRGAEETADAVDAAAGRGWAAAPWVSGARVAVAHATLLRGRPHRALTLAAAGLDATPDGAAGRLALHVLHGAALVDLGYPTAGFDEMHRARLAVLGADLDAAEVATAALLEQEVALRLDRHTAASSVLGWLADRAVAPQELALARARAAAATGAFAQARELVRPVLTGSAAPVLPTTVVEGWVVEANAGAAARDARRTRTALDRATELAQPMDAVRPFLPVVEDAAAVLVDLSVAAPSPRACFAARILARRAAATRPANVGLSGREHDVMVRLASLRTLEEIAEELEVSVNTIKTHLRSIYLKLGVASRRAAVVTAHNRGLIA